MTNKDERYIKIAKACLRALNDVSTGTEDTQKNIQSVYDAIDLAFRTEFSTIEQSRYIAEQALVAIDNLSSGSSLEQAKHIAQAALKSMDHPEASGKHH
ncbi:hypothetical protein BTA51_16850 [Hahella sp. CCB-MM4]|uniref:hypothetical protein n=1 Tax=Hahella sp. (strain CCB-MM4) TaxID=1926491 RepID=UPI000B9A333F|nr:hypothetical protein [Hahella sp. CCB-MM4]OZG72043.1 hypothetical protein BTA51_16850 [Hahella sp. CCB-MM4]